MRTLCRICLHAWIPAAGHIPGAFIQGRRCRRCETENFNPGGEQWAEEEDFLDWLAGPGVDYADREGIPHGDGDARTFTPDRLGRMRDRWEYERQSEGEHQDEAKARQW